jgi:hypothetical protein
MNCSRIVCASDRSEMSQSVLAFAVALAKWERADLHVLHLMDRDEEPRIQSPLIPGKRPATVLIRDDDPARAIVARVLVVPAISDSATWDEAHDGRERIGALSREQLASVHTVGESASHVGGMV